MDDLDFLERECLAVVPVDLPTGAGDADVCWTVYSYHMGKPAVRVEGYGSTPKEAIADARAKMSPTEREGDGDA